jgi:hypothetical protein
MDINIEGFDFSQGRKRKSCAECGSIEHTSPRCPNKPCSHCNEIGHVFSTCLVAFNNSINEIKLDPNTIVAEIKNIKHSKRQTVF